MKKARESNVPSCFIVTFNDFQGSPISLPTNGRPFSSTLRELDSQWGNLLRLL